MNDSKQLMQSLLMSSNWNVCNLRLAQYFKSNDASILIGYLISKDKYFSKHTEQYKGWFFRTVKKIERDTACSERTQRRLIEVFKNINLIEVKVMGLPAKKYFKINYNALQVLFDDSSCETSELDVAKRQNKSLRNVIPIYNTKNKTKTIMEENKKFSSLMQTNKFIKPEHFKAFWEMYPIKKSKAQSIISWEKQCLLPINKGLVTRPKWKEIKTSIQEHLKSERWQKQPEKIPHASTWLNQHRWLNEDVANDKVIVDFNAPKRNNSTGYQGGYKVTTESIQM